MNLMLPDSGLIFWMTIIFAIVFYVLAKFGFPMITGMVEKRKTRIEEAIEAARKAEDAIARLSGIRCGFKNTSCPDQLAKAIELCLAEEPVNS